MNKIVTKKQFSDKVFLFEIEAPLIAQSRKAGHFCIVRVDKKSERMPLTLVDSDLKAGTITLVVQEVGLSSAKMCKLNEGDYLADVVGPLGNATPMENYGTVICAGGGVGIAPVLPLARELKAAGNRVLSVLAGRTKELIILEDELKATSDETIIMTDDGTYGQKGVVTVGMEQLIKQEHIDKIFAIGPPAMMKFCTLTARQHDIPIIVSLNTIMVDGTGMCGACRLNIGGETKFVCIDGPDFDGALVDWDEMFKRLNTFRHEEQYDMKHYKEHVEEEEQPEQPKKPAVKMDFEPTDETIEQLTDRNAPWRLELRKSMKGRERMAIPRVEMPELEPAYRAEVLNEEVSQGLSKEMAEQEAKRCLDCAKPTCIEGCPVRIDIPSFIKNIERGQFLAAAKVLKNTSALPAVCGRVCPQEKQCESKCLHLKMKDKSVAIGYLERFAADYERESGRMTTPQMAKPNNVKIAVVGSGPSGLSMAGDMAKAGFSVYVFEALHEIGGVLKYGIPVFRLPNEIVDKEVDNLKNMGVHFITDCIVGKTVTIEQLWGKGFKGIFIGSGAGSPKFMNIPGENAINILSSNEYLTRINLMDAANPTSDTPINLGKHVMVVGGGNTAMDSCRVAKRMGADVTLVYRRSEAEMPARKEEIRHAKEEGIRFLTLHNPVEYLTNEDGTVRAAVLQEMRLGEPDESGRRHPEPIPGSKMEVETDQVIVAIGVVPNPLIPQSVAGLELGKKNTIVVNEKMQSNISSIYAGGDIVRGGATVILAMGDGRRAAANMIKQFTNERKNF